MTPLQIKNMSEFLNLDTDVMMCLMSFYVSSTDWHVIALKQFDDIKDQVPLSKSYVWQNMGVAMVNSCWFCRYIDFIRIMECAATEKAEVYLVISPSRETVGLSLDCMTYIGGTWPIISSDGYKSVNGIVDFKSFEILRCRFSAEEYKKLEKYLKKCADSSNTEIEFTRSINDDMASTGTKVNITIKNDKQPNNILILDTSIPVDIGCLKAQYKIHLRSEDFKIGLALPKKLKKIDAMKWSIKYNSVRCMDIQYLYDRDGPILLSRVPIMPVGGDEAFGRADL